MRLGTLEDGVALDGFQDRRAEGEVGNEVAVHDIEMKLVNACVLGGFDGIGEVSEVGR